MSKQMEAQREAPFLWIHTLADTGETDLPEERIYLGILRVLALLLDRPDPSAAGEVAEALRTLERDILGPIRSGGYEDWEIGIRGINLRAVVHALPSAEECFLLPLAQVYSDSSPGEQLDRHQAALAAYSAKGSALVFGRNGPHQRANGVPGSDPNDLRGAPLLLPGFVVHLDRLLNQVEAERAGWTSAAGNGQEARDYTGALWNGLMVAVGEGDVQRYRRRYFDLLAQSAARQGVDLPALLRRSARLFPDLLPADRVPEFLLYSPRRLFSTDEIADGLGPYNRDSGAPPLTLWDATVGRDEAGAYLRQFSVPWRTNTKNATEFLRRIYYFLRDVGPADSFASGLEERDLIVELGEEGQANYRAILQEMERTPGGDLLDLASLAGRLGEGELSLCDFAQGGMAASRSGSSMQDGETPEWNVTAAMLPGTYNEAALIPYLERAEESTSSFALKVLFQTDEVAPRPVRVEVPNLDADSERFPKTAEVGIHRTFNGNLLISIDNMPDLETLARHIPLLAALFAHLLKPGTVLSSAGLEESGGDQFVPRYRIPDDGQTRKQYKNDYGGRQGRKRLADDQADHLKEFIQTRLVGSGRIRSDPEMQEFLEGLVQEQGDDGLSPRQRIQERVRTDEGAYLQAMGTAGEDPETGRQVISIAEELLEEGIQAARNGFFQNDAVELLIEVIVHEFNHVLDAEKGRLKELLDEIDRLSLPGPSADAIRKQLRYAVIESSAIFRTGQAAFGATYAPDPNNLLEGAANYRYANGKSVPYAVGVRLAIGGEPAADVAGNTPYQQYLLDVKQVMRRISGSSAGLEEGELARAVADPGVRAALGSQGFAQVRGGYIAEAASLAGERALVFQTGLEEPAGLPAGVSVLRADETTVAGMLVYLNRLARERGYDVAFSTEYMSLEQAQAAVPLAAPGQEPPGSVLLPPGSGITARDLGAVFVVSRRTGILYVIGVTEFTSPDWEKPLIYIRTQA